MSWLGVYARAVVTPAYRRAAAVWVGCLFIVAVVFGGSGMYPRDLTGMAFDDPAGIGLVLAGIWILVFLPIARQLVRAEPARWLRSLPHDANSARLVIGLALIGLQVPWLVLWILGAGWRGAIVFATTTLVLVALSLIRAPRLRARWPGWRSATGAMAAIHRRAIARRAGDAMLRAAGLAALAGIMGALFVRNNKLDGIDGAILGASVATIVLVPARIGPLGVILDCHRRSSWLAESMGASPFARRVAIAMTLVGIHLVTAAIALGVAAIVLRDSSTMIAWIGCAIAIAIGSAMFETGVIVRAERAPDASPIVAGALVGAALAAVALGLFGVVGLAGYVASGLAMGLANTRARSPVDTPSYPSA